jgi:hypothetical protein
LRCACGSGIGTDYAFVEVREQDVALQAAKNDGKCEASRGHSDEVDKGFHYCLRTEKAKLPFRFFIFIKFCVLNSGTIQLIFPSIYRRDDLSLRLATKIRKGLADLMIFMAMAM